MSLRILGESETHAHLAALAAGDWTIVDQLDRDGRRYVVAIRARPDARRRRLTAREVAVVERVARGCSNKEIASDLGLALSTVGGHVAMAMARLGVESRVGLVARWNLLEDLRARTSSGAPAAGRTPTSA